MGVPSRGSRRWRRAPVAGSHRGSHALAALILAVVLAGCGSSGDQAASPSASLPTPTAAATASPTPTTSSSALDLPSVPRGSLLLVGIGDSVPGAGDHDDPPTYACGDCTSYVTLYGELAAAALDKPVVVSNLATNDGVESGQLLERVRADERHRAAIAAADIITLTIGTNDWQGPCGWPNDGACWATGLARVPANVGAILDEILALRAGRPTAIRLTTYYDPYIGFPTNLTGAGDPDGPMPQAFLDFYRVEQAKFYGALCHEADARRVVCVDLWTPFNGPSHDQPATDLLLADHVHPSQAGHRLIAETVAAVGFGELE